MQFGNLGDWKRNNPSGINLARLYRDEITSKTINRSISPYGSHADSTTPTTESNDLHCITSLHGNESSRTISINTIAMNTQILQPSSNQNASQSSLYPECYTPETFLFLLEAQ